MVIRLPIEKGLPNLMLLENIKFYSNPDMNQPYLEKLYCAMLVTGYYRLLRVGELTHGPHVILARNVHIGENKNKFLFLLSSSKTHSKGSKPQLAKISQKPLGKNRNNKPICMKNCNLYNILRNYIQVRPPARSEHEQFFVFADNSVVKPENLRANLKLMLTRLNLDADLYNVHSLRIGCCCDLLRFGLSVETIKKIGCWRLNAVFTYLHN